MQNEEESYTLLLGDWSLTSTEIPISQHATLVDTVQPVIQQKSGGVFLAGRVRKELASFPIPGRFCGKNDHCWRMRVVL